MFAQDLDGVAPLPFDSRLSAELIFSSGKKVTLKSAFEGLGLPTLVHTCKSPAEAMGKVRIPIAADCGLPANKWVQLGSLETDDVILQIQLGRLTETSARHAASDPVERNKKSLYCYAIKVRDLTRNTRVGSGDS